MEACSHRVPVCTLIRGAARKPFSSTRTSAPHLLRVSITARRGAKQISVGSELHAAPSAPYFSSFSPLPLALPLTPENSPGEGGASKWRVTDIRLERLKRPDVLAEDLEKLGGTSASDDSHILCGNPGDPDVLGLAFSHSRGHE